MKKWFGYWGGAFFLSFLFCSRRWKATLNIAIVPTGLFLLVFPYF